MSRPYAAFDIDGTILRWQLYHAIADALAKQGVFDPKEFEKVRLARMTWKRREDSDAFRKYEQALVGVFDAALTGLDQATFDSAAHQVFNEYKDQVYTYTRNLIQDLKAKGYLLFAISGSPAVIVQRFADYYGFDDFAATQYGVSAGKFTGQKDLTIGKKAELLKALVDKHSATQIRSIAVGDSEGDITMLESVEQPIAFNPSLGLAQYARDNKWPIVLERKNVVYELRPEDGKYRLQDS